MDFRWVVGMVIWTLLSGPVLHQPPKNVAPTTHPSSNDQAYKAVLPSRPTH